MSFMSRHPSPAEEQLQRANSQLIAMASQIDGLRHQLHQAEDRVRLAASSRSGADASTAVMRGQVAELTAEVDGLRALLEVEKLKRGTDRRCAVCHDPMPWGTAHYCHRTSEYREEVAA